MTLLRRAHRAYMLWRLRRLQDKWRILHFYVRICDQLFGVENLDLYRNRVIAANAAATRYQAHLARCEDLGYIS